MGILSKWVIITTLVMLLLIGCTTNDQAKHLEEVTQASEEPVVIRVAYFARSEAATSMTMIIESFMAKHPNIVIETVHSNWGSHHERIKAELAAGVGPDVYLLDSVFVQQYAMSGVLEDITEKAEMFSSEKYDGIDQLRDVNNRLFGLPQGIQVDVLYYNKTIFDKMGVAYPTEDWTLDDLASAAIRLTTDEHFGFVIPVNNLRYGWYPIIRQFDGDILDDSRTQSTIVSDPNVKNAMQFIYDAWNKHAYVPTFENWSTEYNANATYFPRGQVAMFYDAYVGTVRSNQAGIDYDVVIQPKQNARFASLISNAWVLNKTSSDKNKEAGWEFMAYYLSDEAQQLHIKHAASLPSNRVIMKEMLSDTSTSPSNKKAFLDSMAFAGTLAENAVWEEQKLIFEHNMIRYLNNEIDLDEFLVETDKELQGLLDKTYDHR